MSEIKTLLKDLETLLSKPTHKPKTKNLKALSDALSARIVETFNYDTTPRLRLSNLGLPPRKMWYELKHSELKEVPNWTLRLMFMYGDLIEQLLLFLVKEAGHKVTGEQKVVQVDGVEGHLDCLIDDEVVDIKSTSAWAFKKFQDGTLAHSDSFGYIPQMASYAKSEGKDRGHFLAMNKVTGELALLTLEGPELGVNPEYLVTKAREVLDSDAPPDKKCYEPVPHGKSGNLVLDINCTYCPFKHTCWKDANDGKGLRSFKYSTGNVEFVKVVKEPRVDEQ